MEFGHRALGNRSILDPRLKENKDRVNKLINLEKILDLLRLQL